MRSLEDVPVHVIREIGDLLAIYKQLEGKTVRVHGCHGPPAPSVRTGLAYTERT